MNTQPRASHRTAHKPHTFTKSNREYHRLYDFTGDHKLSSLDLCISNLKRTHRNIWPAFQCTNNNSGCVISWTSLDPIWIKWGYRRKSSTNVYQLEIEKIVDTTLWNLFTMVKSAINASHNSWSVWPFHLFVQKSADAASWYGMAWYDIQTIHVRNQHYRCVLSISLEAQSAFRVLETRLDTIEALKVWCCEKYKDARLGWLTISFSAFNPRNGTLSTEFLSITINTFYNYLWLFGYHTYYQ